MPVQDFLRRHLPVIATVVMLVVAFGVGWFLGNRATSGEKFAETSVGTAVLVNKAKGRAVFIPEGGGPRLPIAWRTVDWQRGDDHGVGRPPCLRKPRNRVQVEVGHLDIRGPGGETLEKRVVWVDCS